MPIIEELIKDIPHHDQLARLDYTCGHCNREVSGRVVSMYKTPDDVPLIKFLLCTSCVQGSIWVHSGDVVPGVSPGKILEGLPPEVNDAYEETRICFANNAFTACELICRKILMYIAVDKGADEGESFEKYLDYLETQGYITPPIKKWADVIRTHGNDSTHKLQKTEKEKAEITFQFTAQLLRIIYEMEYLANKFASSKKTNIS